MHLKAILNAVEKQKGFVYQSAEFTDGHREILVKIRPHGRSRPICSGCSRKRPGYDTLPSRRFEFVPLWQISVFFFYALRLSVQFTDERIETLRFATGKLNAAMQAVWEKLLKW